MCHTDCVNLSENLLVDKWQVVLAPKIQWADQIEARLSCSSVWCMTYSPAFFWEQREEQQLVAQMRALQQRRAEDGNGRDEVRRHRAPRSGEAREASVGHPSGTATQQPRLDNTASRHCARRHTRLALSVDLSGTQRASWDHNSPVFAPSSGQGKSHEVVHLYRFQTPKHCTQTQKYTLVHSKRETASAVEKHGRLMETSRTHLWKNFRVRKFLKKGNAATALWSTASCIQSASDIASFSPPGTTRKTPNVQKM